MKTYIIANWKANKSVSAAKQWCTDFLAARPTSEHTVVICPGFQLLQTVAAELQSSTYALGAQTVSPFAQGAYTGAVAATQLSELHVQYVLVGHSERRKYFHETSEVVAQQVSQALQAGSTPVVCIDVPYLHEQLSLIPESELQQCLVAYEPLASIGTGVHEDVGSVQSVVSQVHAFSAEVPVLYGGSVNSENVQEYCLVTRGVLVGGASLDAAAFADLVAAVA